MPSETELVEQWFPLAKMYARRAAANSRLSYEDALSASMEGVLLGVRKYLQSDARYAVGTYIAPRVRYCLRNARDRDKRTSLPLMRADSNEELDENAFVAIDRQDRGSSSDFEFALPSHQRLAALYQLGYTDSESARILGISRQRVGQLKRDMKHALELRRDNGGSE